MENGRRMLGLKEAASRLGVSPSTLRYWCNTGRVKFVRTLGGARRIPEEEVLRLEREMGLTFTSRTEDLLERLNPRSMLERKAFGDLLQLARELKQFDLASIIQASGYSPEICEEFCRRLLDLGALESKDKRTFRLRA